MTPRTTPDTIRLSSVAFAAMLFYAPIQTSVSARSLSVITWLTVVFWVLSFADILTGKVKVGTVSGPALPAVLLLLYGWLSVYWSLDPYLSTDRGMGASRVLLTFAFAASMQPNARERRMFTSAVLLGGAAAVGYLNLGEASMVSAKGRLFLPDAIGPNGVAALLLAPFFVSISALGGSGFKRRVILGLLAAALLVTILATGSRGAFMGVVAGGAVGLIHGCKTGNSRSSVLTMVGILAVTAIIVAPSADVLVPRLLQGDSYLAETTGETGRTQIWLRAVRDVLPETPVWGLGLGRSASVLGAYRGAPLGTHNTYLQVLMDLGLLGFSLFIWVLWRLLQQVRVWDGPGLSLAAAVIVTAFFLDEYNAISLWVPLAYLATVSTPSASAERDT